MAQIPGPVWRAVRSAAGLWHDNMDWVTTAAYGLVTSLVLWLVGLAVFAIFPALQAATEGSLSAHWPKNLVLGVLGAVGAC
ncbi:hypothetical protein, partial [Streptomyces brasiliscabiei]|uniref:hypothetical protein n=1 Tax=Streptomyces brasiliscabiei TaxID=2736302 RepID=UPI0030157AAB